MIQVKGIASKTPAKGLICHGIVSPLEPLHPIPYMSHNLEGGESMPQDNTKVRQQDTVRGLMPSDLAYFRWVEEIVISPDGRHVAYTVRQVDVANNGYIVDVFLLTLDGDQTPMRLTSGNGSASSDMTDSTGWHQITHHEAPATLAWSHDSQCLAYVHSEKGAYAVRIVDLDGTQTEYPVKGNPPSSLSWSPDGERLACVRWTQVKRGDEPVYGDPWPVAPTMRVITRRLYKLNEAGFIHDRYRHIWMLELNSGQWTQITDGENDYGQPQWSHSGDRLVFVRMDREVNTAIGAGELVVWHASDGRIESPLAHWQGIAQSPCWASDDSVIVFTGHQAPAMENWRAYFTVYRYDFPDGTLTDLLPDISEAVGRYHAVTDQPRGGLNITVRWPQGSDRIYFLLTEKGAVNLYSMDVSGGDRRKLAGDRSVVFEYAPAADRVVYGEANPTNPGDLWLLEGGERRRLTNLNPWLTFRRLSEPEEYWYKGLEEADVHAWIMRPIDFDPTKRYPLVLQVHCAMFSWDFHFENQILAEAGYVVAYFNQRGTTAGYGEAWTQAILGNPEDVDFQEIMVGVDDLLERYPFIDGDRMGVTGASCGGLLTNWIVGHTDRFKAAVTKASVTNDISRIGAADTGPLHILSELRTHPWEDLEAVWRASPIAYAANINTPLLIMHSDEDHRCPIEQAEELFTVLRWMGKEVEFCWFEGETHALSRGRPVNRVEWLRRVVGWFQKYLGTEPTWDPSKSP